MEDAAQSRTLRGIFDSSTKGLNSRRQFLFEKFLLEQNPDHFSCFKNELLYPIEKPRMRALPRVCTDCTPDISVFSKDTDAHFGVANLLWNDHMDTDRPWWSRMMPYFSKYVLSKQIRFDEMKKWPSCSGSTLVCPLCVQKLTRSSGYDSSLSRLFKRTVLWILGRIFWCLFGGIMIHKGEVRSLTRCEAIGHPLVYTMAHQSWLDYFVLCWTLASNHLKMPKYFCPSYLTDAAFTRYPAKILGAVYGIDKVVNDENPQQFCTTISEGIRLMMESDDPFSFVVNLQRHRSLDGKNANLNVGGVELLSMMTSSSHSYCENGNGTENVYIVPVSISYERLFEEQTKCRMPRLSILLTRLMKSIFLQSEEKPFIRINFSTPISLMEFRTCIQKTEKFKYQTTAMFHNLEKVDEIYIPTLNEITDWKDNSSICSISPIMTQVLDVRDVESDHNFLLNDFLISHSIYDSSRCGAIMSTDFLSFLLVNKFRNGASLSTICNVSLTILDILKIMKRDVGFSGDIEFIMERAVRILSDHLKVNEVASVLSEGGFQDLFIKAKPESFVHLLYYANRLSSEFCLLSCIATAIYFLAGSDLDMCNGTGTELRLRKAKLYEHFTSILGTLQLTDVFYKPCLTVDAAFEQGLQELVHLKILYVPPIRPHSHSDDDYDDYEDYEEDEFTSKKYSEFEEIVVIRSESGMNTLNIFMDISRPVLFAYGLLFKGLKFCFGSVETLRIGKEDLYNKLMIYFNDEMNIVNFYYGTTVTKDFIRSFVHTIFTYGYLEKMENEYALNLSKLNGLAEIDEIGNRILQYVVF